MNTFKPILSNQPLQSHIQSSISVLKPITQEDDMYSKYIFHNAKQFREKFKVNNTILEKIWDANFKKKNARCPNCNIYGICKPINNRCLNNPRKFPFGLIAAITEKASKIEEFTFICYMS